MTGIIISIVIVVPIIFCISFIAYLTHASDRGEYVKIRLLPNLIPWSAQARLRRTKVETQITAERVRLIEERHALRQREIILDELEEANLKRALESPPPQVSTRP